MPKKKLNNKRMSKAKIKQEIQALGQDTRYYARIRLDLLKLDLTESTAKVFAFFMTLLIMIGFGFFALLFVAVIIWFAFLHITDSFIWASTIVALLYILLGIISYSLRKSLILDPMINVLMRIIHKNEKEENDG